MSLLFLSNGYGEDTIAVAIIKELKKRDSNLDILALPLVGDGSIYKKADLEPLVAQNILPSGGLIPAGFLKLIWRDLKAGLWRLTKKQIKALKHVRDKVSLSIAVGDLFPVVLSGVFVKKPQIFVGTAKSNYFCKYSLLEKTALKKYCQIIFPRDKITAQDLRKSNISAQWVGNIMMDSFQITGEDFNLTPEEICLGILPGSRKDVLQNLLVLLKAFEKINFKLRHRIVFLIALAESVPSEKINQLLVDFNWQVKAPDEFIKDKARLILTKEKFGDIINCARLILGQAGTANEQAAGLGKPVIAFDNNPKKLKWYRLRQKGLLGEALKVVESSPEIIAQAVVELLTDDAECKRRSQAGITRMGPKGGAVKVAEYILEIVNSQ